MAAVGDLPAPPAPPREVRIPLATRLSPVLMALSSIGMVAMLAGSPTGGSSHRMMWLLPITMIGSALANLVATGRAGAQRRERDEQRYRYLDRLADTHRSLTESAAAQRNRMLARYPEPHALWALIGTPDMWQVGRSDPSFGRVRIGRGRCPAESGPAVPDIAEDADPLLVAAFRRLVDGHAELADAPVSIALPDGAAVGVTGTPEEVRTLIRAVLCGLAVTHPPDELSITAAVDECEAPYWDWLKWLPHNNSGSQFVIVVGDGTADKAAGAALPAGRVELRIGGTVQEHTLELVDNRLTTRGFGLCATALEPDRLDEASAAECARRLAAVHRPAGPADTGDLRVRLGLGESGTPVYLDIKEAAHGGMGPHGLCVGATGSGKSELLRTVALGMIAAHPPEELNLALVDFKGGATFLGLDRTNHVAAVITNLADEAALVDRMAEALTGEIARRQQLLRAAGNLAGITEYRRARATGAPLPPLPVLFLIIDEFSELLIQHPEFAEVFAAIGRLGRSLGMHLLLATQRLDEGRLRGLETHLSYRICLKTLSATESRAVLGTPAAYELPAVPGAAYLKVGSADPVAFRCDYVSGPAPATLAPASEPQLFTAASATAPPTPDAPTLLDVTLAALAGTGTPAHQIWLPPLTRSPELADLDGARAPWTATIGLVDRVAEQRRTPWRVDLSGADGNVAVVGAARSGKSTTLVTLITALALGADPRDLCVHCLDFGGGLLTGLAELPQVATVATRAEPDLVRRIVTHLQAEVHRRDVAGPMAQRPRIFLVIDGLATLRQEFDDLEPAITALAGAGLGVGIHLVLATPRWADIRPALKDHLGTRIELRLGEPLDSEVDRHRAAAVPRNCSGAGLTTDGQPGRIARPGPPADTAKILMARDPGHRAEPVRLLPTLVTAAELGDSVGLPVGLVDDDELSTVGIEFTDQPHLLILGDSGAGKTAVLRLLCRQLLADRAPGTLRFFLSDPRGSLADLLPSDCLLAGVDDLLDVVGGPETVVVCDDYDLLGAAGAAALEPLIEPAARARDLRLRILLARRSTGSGRAMYDPLIAALRDTDPIGLALSGSPEEPALLGTVRPRRLPPGRGVLITRGDDPRRVQLAWSPPR
ncbi:MAG: type VII secretion protein EccCb [Mycolicibacterium insubricum]|nr:type VII secretion protein EccCb [Mycobacterium sp.]